MDELRVVVGYAVASAQDVLALFEEAAQDDARPRAAVEAALKFTNGGLRTNLQRSSARDAHRAAKDVADEAAQHAARSAGDAAAAAYLHPLAQATQVAHILRAAASAARAAKVRAGGDTGASDELIERARRRASPILVDVLRRYPLAPSGRGRVANLMQALDTSLRAVR